MNEHRKIGKQLNLFDLHDYAPGMVHWLPAGHRVYRKVEGYMRQIQEENGYLEVKSPPMANMSLWEQSGHADKYREEMLHVSDHGLAVKPMSCPFHIQMFSQLVKSYRDLPLRIAEFGLCHRNEPSGALNGLFRLRSFNQDDGHIFCEHMHVGSELKRFCGMVFDVYKKFGFDRHAVNVSISLRPEQRIGGDALWDEGESSLRSALDELEISHVLQPGEGAFYGPKVEFALRDALGREWQCGTFQLDFFLAERFGAGYMKADGSQGYPVILHRAALGSIERFIAILIEHHQGKLPAWLNPHAVSIIPVNGEAHKQFSYHVAARLRSSGIDAVVDAGEESVGKRIRAGYSRKHNHHIVIGDEEVDSLLLSLGGRPPAPLDDVVSLILE